MKGRCTANVFMPLSRFLALIAGLALILGLLIWLVDSLSRLYWQLSYSPLLFQALLVLILAVLAEDLNPTVRYWVAMKRKLPENLQLKLARDIDESVRIRIARNAKATASVMQILSADVEPLVRDAAGREQGSATAAE